MTAHPFVWIRTANGTAFSDVPIHSGGRMPDFCIIGAAKSGTTALNRMLSSHPDIFMCDLKEPHYFSTPQILEKGENWYRGLYADAGPDQICGEASTSYARFPLVAGTAQRMAIANPDMRLIYILREPVSRVESEMLQIYKYVENVLGETIKSTDLDAFFRDVETEGHPYYQASVDSSDYHKQIAAFETVFPAENILVLMQEDLLRETKMILDRVYSFLGVTPDHNDVSSVRSNVSADYLSGKRRMETTTRLRHLPFYDIAKKIIPDTIKNRIIASASGKVESSRLKFSDDLRDELSNRFVEPNRRLKNRLGALPPGWSY